MLQRVRARSQSSRRFQCPANNCHFISSNETHLMLHRLELHGSSLTRDTPHVAAKCTRIRFRRLPKTIYRPLQIQNPSSEPEYANESLIMDLINILKKFVIANDLNKTEICQSFHKSLRRIRIQGHPEKLAQLEIARQWYYQNRSRFIY